VLTIEHMCAQLRLIEHYSPRVGLRGLNE